MRDILIDVRCLQDASHAQTPQGQQARALLGRARLELPRDELVGLMDPALPPLAEGVRASLDRVRVTAYTGALTRPACFVQLSPLTHDPLFVARLLMDQRIPCVTIAPTRSPGRMQAADRIRGVVARHWLRRYDLAVAEPVLWEAVAGLSWKAAAPAAVTGRRARIALIDPSGDATLRSALESVADVDVVTPADPVATLRKRYDRVISVVANTKLHAPVVDAIARQGGACILRDGCLIRAYDVARWKQRSRKLAELELGRALGPGELEGWLAGHALPRARLLGEIAAAEKLFVHSEAFAAAIASASGQAPRALPMPLAIGDWPAAGRTPRRDGPGTDQSIVASATGHMAESCFWALDLLRHWGVPARLHLFGPLPADSVWLDEVAARLGLADRVVITPGPAPEHSAAADVGVFLCMRGQGSVGMEMAASAARGLPCVASESVAEPFAQPAWVRTISDMPSPVLLAEAIAAVLARPPEVEELAAWRREHSPAAFARALGHALDIG